ncbi:sugar phosphate isomerase/epimerase [Mesobacillus foraminis]|uniref:sugar phosphate isomerase/epimerase family protein n=1 Tax=Mesobacillus foraminis TaxID=279826 RepID=UPI001BEC4E26|nr:TIM barrel protein [Mesobacillus foraminis]MBT2758164.1 sugar phosphate isomerase/epimerase [Mesobacillus foraminis]
MDKGDFSFSTCWNIKRSRTGREMIEEIKDLGFSQVELNYNVTKEMLSSIRPLINQGEIQISSVHNVFPFIDDPEYDTDSVMLGFEEREKRKKAVDYLKKSAEYAQELGARGVVVHPGEVPFSYNIDSELKKVYHTLGKDSKEYQALWKEMMLRRQSESGDFIRRIQNSLEEVCEYLAKKQYNIGIGIETRSRCYQIPTLEEAGTIIDNLPGAPVYLWYDIGHAMMMERMGLYDCASHTNELKGKILGVHIHETIDLSDHWCPYIHSQEEKFFDPYIQIINDSQVKVYELKDKCTPDDIHQSHQMIREKIDKFGRIKSIIVP